jgi:phosphoglycerate dehydrogenase-like enzyme
VTPAAAAGLDVFEREPLPSDHPLWNLENVLVTPHVAGFSKGFWRPIVDLFLDNLGRFKRGEPLLNIVDKRAGY